MPRDRVWKNWDRTEFEPNHYQVVGLAGVCLKRDELEKAHRTRLARARGGGRTSSSSSRSRRDSIIVRGAIGNLGDRAPAHDLRGDHGAATHADFDRALAALDAAFPGGRVAGKIVSEEITAGGSLDDISSTTSPRKMAGAARRPGPTRRSSSSSRRRARACSVGGREVVMLTSNNYLGFANHPRIREAQKKAVDRWGAGLGSVRFICGTQELHKELEAEIASFFGTRRHDPLHVLLERQRGALRRRPRRARRPLLRRAQPRLDHRRRAALQGEAVPGAAQRPEGARPDARARTRPRASASSSPTASSRWRARRRTCRELVRDLRAARRLLVVDDSHATGVLGKTGRGTAEEQGVLDRDPVSHRHARQGDGLGGGRLRDGAEGARRDAPPAEPHVPLLELAAARRRRGIARGVPDARARTPRRSRSCARTRAYFRKAISDAGFRIPHGTHPIVPVIVGDTAKALAMGKALFEEGVYVSGLRLPGRAAGSGAPALPGLRRARAGRPGPRRRGVPQGGPSFRSPDRIKPFAAPRGPRPMALWCLCHPSPLGYN